MDQKIFDHEHLVSTWWFSFKIDNIKFILLRKDGWFNQITGHTINDQGSCMYCDMEQWLNK